MTWQAMMAICDAISREIGERYDEPHTVDEALRTGRSLTTYGKTREIQRYMPIGEGIAAEGILALTNSIGGKYRFADIVRSGGGAHLFRKADRLQKQGCWSWPTRSTPTCAASSVPASTDCAPRPPPIPVNEHTMKRSESDDESPGPESTGRDEPMLEFYAQGGAWQHGPLYEDLARLPSHPLRHRPACAERPRAAEDCMCESTARIRHTKVKGVSLKRS